MFVLTFILLRVHPGGSGGVGRGRCPRCRCRCRRRRRSHRRRRRRRTGRPCLRRRRWRRRRRFLGVFYLHRPRLELHLERPSVLLRLPTKRVLCRFQLGDRGHPQLDHRLSAACIPRILSSRCGNLSLLRWSQRETIYPQWNLECTMRCRRRRPLSLCDSPETEEDAVIFSDSGAQATVDNASSRRAPSRPRPPAASPHAQSRTRTRAAQT